MLRDFYHDLCGVFNLRSVDVQVRHQSNQLRAKRKGSHAFLGKQFHETIGRRQVDSQFEQDNVGIDLVGGKTQAIGAAYGRGQQLGIKIVRNQ